MMVIKYIMSIFYMTIHFIYVCTCKHAYHTYEEYSSKKMHTKNDH